MVQHRIETADQGQQVSDELRLRLGESNEGGTQRPVALPGHFRIIQQRVRQVGRGRRLTVTIGKVSSGGPSSLHAARLGRCGAG